MATMVVNPECEKLNSSSEEPSLALRNRVITAAAVFWHFRSLKSATTNRGATQISFPSNDTCQQKTFLTYIAVL